MQHSRIALNEIALLFVGTSMKDLSALEHSILIKVTQALDLSPITQGEEEEIRGFSYKNHPQERRWS